jgi:(p)ppGpp synthase/HD superfamily hydrolase
MWRPALVPPMGSGYPAKMPVNQARADIIALAAQLHAGQTDKAGQPYVGHLARVAARLVQRWPDATRDEIEAAWLHDCLEDTEATEASLLAAGVSPRTIEIVRAVTRPEGSDYLAWIAVLAARQDVSVLRVKLADNADNIDPERVAALPGAAERVASRYEPARRMLENGLAATGA